MENDDVRLIVDAEYEGVAVEVKRWGGRTGLEAEQAFFEHCRGKVPPGAGMKFLLHVMQEEATTVTAAVDPSSPRHFTPSETDSVPLSAAPRIVLPPGTSAGRLLCYILAPRFFRIHVQVVITEMQAEYIEHLAAGRKWAARISVVRGHLMLFVPLLRSLVPAAARKLL